MSVILEQLLEKLTFHPISLLPLLILLIFLYKWKSTTLNSPPSPPKLPIIGNLHQLGTFPHRSLRLLSQKYGKLMLLHLGSKPTLVVSCPRAAEQIMKTHDIVFANRPNLHFVSKIFYGGTDIAFGSYGEHWRNLKSIATLQLLSTKKVQSFRSIRAQEVALMAQKIKALKGSPVNLSTTILTVVNDVISRTTLGRKHSTNLEELFKGFSHVLGAFSIGDFIPWLGWIDRVTGLENRTKMVGEGFDEFFSKVIQEHDEAAQNINGKENVDDFVDLLLQVQKENPDALSLDSIKGLLLDMFVGGSETTYTVLEWTMTELLKHPRVLKKLQEEVRKKVKSQKVGVTEDDLGNMTYLTATIKEALRLHLPSPLLAFRESSNDVKINGYDVAAGTVVIINAWAIQRDPDYWEEPEEFRPERFLNSAVDFNGQHFEFIPFGAGRRGCPGRLYGTTMLHLLLASLLYEFDWNLPDGAAPENLDMAERAGISIHRKHPLMLVATPYSPISLCHEVII